MASFPDKEMGVSLGHEIKEQPSSFYLSLLHSSEHAGPYQQAEINCSHNYIISKKTDAQTLVLLKKTTSDSKIKNTRDLGLKPDKNQHAENTLKKKKKDEGKQDLPCNKGNVCIVRKIQNLPQTTQRD